MRVAGRWVIGLLAGTGLLLWQVEVAGPLVDLDQWIADTVNDAIHAWSWLIGPLEALTWLGRLQNVVALLLVAVGLSLAARRIRPALLLVVAPASGQLLNLWTKQAVGRPRPVVDHAVASAGGWSFPSGHAMLSTVVYGSLLLVVLPLMAAHHRRRSVMVVTVFVLAIGATRVLLGVHFLTDVVAGHLLGGALLLVLAAALGIVPATAAEPTEASGP